MALGGDPKTINPQVQCDLVIDHSVIADEAGCAGALQKNMEPEFDRNKERYEFLKWAQESFENVRIVPPGAGICHQLNIERFASVTMTKDGGEGPLAYFDTLVGTDSHTPTANGIGVLGWGVGGIEAEAAALGQPITTLVPRVIGIKLSGSLQPGVSAMDVSLTFAQMLRAEGVVGCFVECFGEGLESLSATQRACISNMTPEYGATCTLFPVDQKTLDYLELTGRNAEQIALVESYAKAQGFWNDPQSEPRIYSKVLELDLSKVQRSVAGPSRPHDRIDLADVKNRFSQLCNDRSLDCSKKVSVDVLGHNYEVTHGALAIAAVTSCTTATDASMMISAGVLARNASKAGLHPKPWVKTILAPGSRATEGILDAAGLMPALRDLGFYTCGFGCMSCIGNSGPVLPGMHDTANEIELASVLSGNRNFEGRISPDVSQNYLCAPALVIAYSLAGTIDFDFETEALGIDAEGNSIYLKDIWPDDEEVTLLLEKSRTKEVFDRAAVGLFDGDERWQSLGKEASDVFAWDPDSTYVRRAPYFDGMGKDPVAPKSVKNARVLLNLGDADYPNLSDAEFGNFRNIATTGMGKDVLYRGSSPINPELGRNTYVDAALKQAGVNVIMNLANSPEEAEAYEGFADTYYSGQKVIYLNLGVDFSAPEFQKGLAEGLRFFAANKGTYYVHCTEGKDRAGFVSALLECLMGATYDEVVADYMVTYYNYYGVEPGTDKYNAIANSNIIKTLQNAFGVEDLSKADLQKGAKDYMKAIGLTDAEITDLMVNLGYVAPVEPVTPSKPATGDAGIVVYLGLGVMALAGGVLVAKKKEQF